MNTPILYGLQILGQSQYEMLCFRGTNPSGEQAFTITIGLHKKPKNKLNLYLNCSMQFKNKPQIFITNNKIIDLADLLPSESLNFENLVMKIDDDNFIVYKHHALEGKITSAENQCSFKLGLAPSNKPLFQYGDLKNYETKIVQKFITEDTIIIYDGEITIGESHFNSMFMGNSFHQFGKRPAKKYLRFNCNQFENFPEAYFEGLYIQDSLFFGLAKPTLKLFSFRIKNSWFHFNPLSKDVNYSYAKLDGKNWEGKLESNDHIFSFVVNGDDSLFCDANLLFPFYQTKFAFGKITLIDKKSDNVIVSITSNQFEIETNMK